MMQQFAPFNAEKCVASMEVPVGYHSPTKGEWFGATMTITAVNTPVPFFFGVKVSSHFSGINAQEGVPD